MLKTDQLNAQIRDWERRAQDARNTIDAAGALALSDGAAVAQTSFVEATQVLQVAERAIVSLRAQLPEAKRLDMLTQADDLDAQSVKLAEQATVIEVEVIGLLDRLQEASGVRYVQPRFGGTPRHLELQAQADAFRFEAAHLRRSAKDLAPA